jgi:5-methylcytosine-specific restriction endonuclease McrA
MHRPHLAPTKREQRRDQDLRRGSAASRGYDKRWSTAAASDRARNPLCAYCELEGRLTPARLTDHLYPHRTYADVFWRKEWWVSSCKSCHDGMKQAAERAGKAALDRLAQLLGRPMLVEGVEAPRVEPLL